MTKELKLKLKPSNHIVTNKFTIPPIIFATLYSIKDSFLSNNTLNKAEIDNKGNKHKVNINSRDKNSDPQPIKDKTINTETKLATTPPRHRIFENKSLDK